jgi:hypothetical protein
MKWKDRLRLLLAYLCNNEPQPAAKVLVIKSPESRDIAETMDEMLRIRKEGGGGYRHQIKMWKQIEGIHPETVDGNWNLAVKGSRIEITEVR